MVTRRVFVSMPADRWLTDEQNAVKWGVVEQIEAQGLTAEVFFDPTGRSSLSSGLSWTPDAAEEVMRHCVGAALIGMPRWSFDSAQGNVRLPTDFCHYEGALARTFGLPLFVLAEEDLTTRVVFADSFGNFVGRVPRDSNVSWLRTAGFEVPFTYWMRKIEERRDVFFGYCSAALPLAKRLVAFIEDDLGASVLDWQRDFVPGRSVLQEIEDARLRCTTGIFLFTRDDASTPAGPRHDAYPRDNVVFEAGYFASSKGKERVLLVVETGTKVPADLGGDIFAALDDRSDLAPTCETLRRFIASL